MLLYIWWTACVIGTLKVIENETDYIYGPDYAPIKPRNTKNLRRPKAR
jgi:hypothetical protein